MKRLTGERGDICINCDESRYCRTNCDRRKQYDKLSHYENLEKQLEEVYGECPDLLETVINVLVKHEGFDLGNQLKSKLLTHEAVDQWERWKKADKEGRLIELPCKIDDFVYCIIGTISYKEPSDPPVYSYRIEERKFKLDMIYRFGKTVFIAREEAEKVLQKMED